MSCAEDRPASRRLFTPNEFCDQTELTSCDSSDSSTENENISSENVSDNDMDVDVEYDVYFSSF